MLLADGISVPIVAAAGLIVYGPLTLLVTTIEGFVFKGLLHVPFRRVFRKVLWANIISTLAGAVAYAFQGFLVEATGIRRSIPAFVHGYVWVSLLLVLLYFVKSAGVEALVVATRRFAAKIERSRRDLLKAVVLGNACSYLAVGPMFYYATRPWFGNLETTEATTWTRNADQTVYYIGRDDKFIKRARLDATGVETLVPFPAEDFVVTGDGQTFAYRGTDGQLYAYRHGHANPVSVGATAERYDMPNASLTADGGRMIFTHVHRPENVGDTYYTLGLLDTASGELTNVPTLHATAWNAPSVCWSAAADVAYVMTETGSLWKVAGVAPYAVTALEPADAPEPEELAANYRGATARPYVRYWQTDEAGDYSVEVYPYFGSHLWIKQKGKSDKLVMNTYGLLKTGWPGLYCPSFVRQSPEVLLEWRNQLYLLDVERRRLGFVADGSGYVTLTPRFRVLLEPRQP